MHMMYHISKKQVLAALALLLLSSFPAYAQGLFDSDPHTRVELLSEVESIQPGQTFSVAVKMRMDQGWHIYWRNPGDTGLETLIEWQLPEGFEAGPTQWPYPERIEEPPLVTFGYHGEIYLLTNITASDQIKPQEKFTISAKVNWLECADVCIPQDAEVEIEIPVEEQSKTSALSVETFADARAQLPLKSSDWKFSAAVEDQHLIVQAEAPEWFTSELTSVKFFPYLQGLIDNSVAQKYEESPGVYFVKVKLGENAELPENLSGVLVAENGWRGPMSEKAIEFETPIGEKLAAVTSGDALSSIWLAILFSFLGGIILNLMPCVLPVLSIKIMGIINQAHDEDTKPWQHGLVFTAGVLVTFWALAGALLILKAGGAQLGWGFQLQEPVFLIFLSVFMFLFGLSMFGVFEIGTSLTTVEGKTQKSSGFMSSFVSGITATIVATPCTAPFMGSALGFALTQPGWVSMTVFTFLGLGMAAPFVVLSSVPALLKFIPKPGRWMESLKQFMGFLLVATVIWLLWVLGLQAGSNVVVLILINLLITAIAAWIYGRWGHLAMPKKTRTVAILIAVVMIVMSNSYAFSNIDTFTVSVQQSTASKGGIEWQAFDQQRIDQLLADGEPVFIDFTAAWCLSCQVNEQVAFSPKRVQDRFKEKGVHTFKADWTSRDDKITAALAKFGRYSVPLYVLYDGKSDQPKLLPEIITPGIILDALDSVE